MIKNLVFGVARHYKSAINALELPSVKDLAKGIVERAKSSFKGRVGSLSLDKFLLAVKANKVQRL
jgi:hypothetical protein